MNARAQFPSGEGLGVGSGEQIANARSWSLSRFKASSERGAFGGRGPIHDSLLFPASGRRGNVVQLLFPRIGRGNDDTHRLLIKSLETAVALEILKMTADRAVAHELFALLA